MPGGDLAASVADAPADSLLPARFRDEGAAVAPNRLTLAASHPLAATGTALGVLRDEAGHLLAGPLVTDAVRGVRRAVAGDGAAHALASSLATRPLTGGGFRTVSLPRAAATAGSSTAESSTAERGMLVDQTHESVVVGERAVVKWAVQAEATPATTLVPHLVEAGFTEMPTPWGFVTWQDPAAPTEVPVLVASVADYLPEASDGWEWAVHDVGELANGTRTWETALAPMQTLGRIVADLHLAFATPTTVIPQPRGKAARDEIAHWQSLAEGLLAAAVAAVDGPEGERLAQRRQQMAHSLSTLGSVAGCTTIPVHGDLHVGQVLRWAGGYAVGDFDGNPVLPVAERLRPQSAARDVAGMLQSIDHVGRVVVRRVEGADAGVVDRWIAEAQQRFLGSYRDRLGEMGQGDLLDSRLLLPLQIEQECREFLYAVHHLPRWRYVPDQALQALFPDV